MGVFFMKNLVPSLSQGGEHEKNTEFTIFFPTPGVIPLIPRASSPSSFYTATKKEILKNIIGFLYDEQRDPKLNEDNFTNYSKNKTISDNYDSKNLKTNDEGKIGFFKRSLVTNSIELDENGNPIVNKFLASHFSEE